MHLAEFTSELRKRGIPEATIRAAEDDIKKTLPAITEDTMPGELANVIAGRIANLFNFRGPNFTTDAACASGLAGIWSAVQGLASHQFDAAISGAKSTISSVSRQLSAMAVPKRNIALIGSWIACPRMVLNPS